MNENQIFDTAIVGGGLAGLTAAALLAQAGKSVIVLEKAAAVGGRGGSTEKEGCMLNYGPHALYRGTAAMRIWNRLGVVPNYAPIAFKLLIIADGKEYPLSSNPLSMMMSPCLSFMDKFELAKFYSMIKKLNPMQYAHISAKQFLQNSLKRPRVRRLFEAFIRTATYAADFDLIGADAAIGQLQSADTLYVHGGWQTIADQLRRRAVEYGAVIRENTAVKAVTGRFPELSVHLEDGDRIQSQTVLSTAGPRETATLFEGVTGVPHEKLFPMPLVPVKAACLDIALSHLPNPDTHFAVNLDDPYYYSVHSKVVSLTTDPSHQVIHVMKYLSVQEPNDPLLDKTELTQYMDRLQPGWERHILHMRYLPQITVSYALPQAEYGGLGGRPDPTVDREAGLYAAGDWAGSEGMLVNASVASAEKATRYIMESIGAGAARKSG